MRILLTGKSGQLGSELEKTLSPLGEVIALSRAELDLLDRGAIEKAVRKTKPGIVVNAAAYTAVDRAESEREAAFAVNAGAAGELAREAKKLGALLVHFSTDYVFDGEKPMPYQEDDATRPLSVYGESKLAGERAVAASGCPYFIFRTSWVYSPRGRNFLRAILAGARDKKALRVVDDQRGAPTSAQAIASAVASVLGKESPAVGLYHMSAAGETTWHGFARAILEAAGLDTTVTAVTTAQYGAKARRPRNSLLDNARFERSFGFRLPDWREGLREVSSKINAF